MSVEYDALTQGFLDKVTEYHFLELSDDVTQGVIDGYMKRACAQFSKICAHNITEFDDINRQILVDIPMDEYYTIIDIISEGMVVQWLKPYAYNAENLENVLTTRDFNMYSPNELLRRVMAIHQTAKTNFTNMMRDYSYQFGDLTDLSLP